MLGEEKWGEESLREVGGGSGAERGMGLEPAAGLSTLCDVGWRETAPRLPEGVEVKLGLLLRSRKFWATVVAIAFIVLGPRAGIEERELTAAVVTMVGYILGTALEDGLRS